MLLGVLWGYCLACEVVDLLIGMIWYLPARLAVCLSVLLNLRFGM